ncbi:biotin synthase BioB [Zavarzinia sp. CC-PAN008]|uniref:biotin synthase BioB n=1 Tax=Zavarzinia sp. CC-PAN008 TaxID=3243332 RepID=UPI003F746360
MPDAAIADANTATSALRHDWTMAEVEALFDLPFADLIFRAQTVHRQAFDPNKVQISTLLSIKTGGCPEDCGYCSQSASFETGVKASKLMPLDAVLADARAAKAAGATRYCMGAAWRSPKERDLDQVCAMVEGVRALGMETCATLGMLTPEQAQRLGQAGLDYYNHNIDTSPEFYNEIITTRTFQDRLDTLDAVRQAGMSVCCGGIVGMGESRTDRASMLLSLANLAVHPESVPINMLIAIEGTKLGGAPRLEGIEFVRTVAVARILMPQSMVRLSAGREGMSDEVQALCFLAGANSIFRGSRLLTAANPVESKDDALFAKLGVGPMDLPERDAHGHDRGHHHHARVTVAAE